jgi:multidrug efflux pump subunit AcrA (membrane-fusion protein)
VRTAQGSNSPYLGEILAPQSGVVVERNVYPGQYVVEGEKLFTLVDASVLWFRFDAYEQQLPWLRPGQTLEVTTASVPGQAFPAVISFIEPSLNDATRSVKVRADVLNPLERGTESPQRLLRLGAYAEAQVRTEIPAVLAVPRAAILFPGGSAYAYVERGHGAYARQRVRLGRQGDDLWEVLGGLAAGDRVVTSGNVLIDAQAQFNQPDRVEEPASDDAGAAGVPQAMAVDAGPGPAVVAQPARSASTPAPGGGLDPAQQKALRAFLVIADGVSQALAADSLAQLGTNTAALPGVASSLRKALGNDHPWRTLLERIEATARWPAPKDLAAARKTFLPFSTNVVALVELARGREPGFRTLKVFHCPMAPKPGLWFQASGPLKNPYYGDEMLTCGEEVAPAPNSGAAASHQAMAEPEQAPPAKAVAPVAEPRPAKPAPPAAAGVSAKPKPRATTPGQETNEAAAATSLEHPSAGHTRVVSAVMSQTDELKAMRREIILKARQADADAAAAAIKAGAPAPPVLTPAAQLAAARQLTLAATLELADGIGQSLAADDLSGFYQRIVGLPTVFTLLRREFDTNHPYAGLIGALITQGLPLAGAGQWRTVDSLAAARERFLPFSTAVVELARVLQHEDAAFAGLKIYHCPPAPPPGLWMQAKGPLQNPFFGVTNRSSGAEVISAAGPSGPPPAPTPSAPAGVPK